MYRQKTIINRQRRNVSQIANVQRKVRQTDRSPCKHTLKYRQSSPCKCNATIDKVQRNYRLSSPCKCNAIDNARPSDSAMLNATPITQSQNSKLFRRQTSPFQLSRATNPQKSKRVNSKENIYTPNRNFPYTQTQKLTIMSDNVTNTSVSFKN